MAVVFSGSGAQEGVNALNGSVGLPYFAQKLDHAGVGELGE
jgi:hypothetical protein